MSLSLFLVGHLFLGMGPFLWVACIPCQTHLKRTDFSFWSDYELDFNFVLCGFCLFLLSEWGPIGSWSVQALCILLQSLWGYIKLGPVSLGSFIPLPQSLTIVLPLLLFGLPDLWGDGLDGDLLFRMECYKVSQSLHIVQLWLCICPQLLKAKASVSTADQTFDVTRGHFMATTL